MKSLVLLLFNFLLVSGNKTVAVDSSVAAPSLALVDPMPFTSEVTCENCTENNATGEVHILPFIDIARPYTIDPLVQEACKFETPEEQFLRVDAENTTEVDFEGYDQMVDNCGRAYRKIEFDRLDTNSKMLNKFRVYQIIIFLEDGKLSWDEWIAEQNKIREAQKQAELQWRQSSFKVADLDEDGSLDLDEFKQYLGNRMLDDTNATEYLNSLEGEKMDFDQFVDFEQTTPNSTFPYKSYPYNPIAYATDDANINGTTKSQKGKKNKNKNKKNKNKNQTDDINLEHFPLIRPAVELPVNDGLMRPAVMNLAVQEPLQVAATSDLGIQSGTADDSGDNKLTATATAATAQNPLVSRIYQRIPDSPAVALPAKLG